MEEEEKEIIEEKEAVVSKEDTETQIKLKMMDEPDWRKRAAMAAMIISKSLE